jgi:DNA replication protein DnaC
MIRSPEFYNERWSQMNIPIKLRGMRLEDFQPVHHSGKIASFEAADFVEDFRNRYVSSKRALRGDIPDNRDNIGKGLMFFGRNGTRKTTLATMILTEVQYLSPSYRGFYLRFSEWQRSLTDTFVKEPTEQSILAKKTLQIAAASHVLVIDDLGQEYRTATGFTRDKLHEMLRVRYESAKPTILTSNLELAEMRDVYGASFDSFRHDAFDAFEMLGKDSRKNKD